MHSAAERFAGVPGEQVQCFDRFSAHPGGENVGIRIVAQPGPRGIGIPVVVFVGTHHTVEVVAIGGAVMAGHGSEQPRHLDDQFGAVLGEPAEIAGALVELPGVVGDSEPYVALPPRVVGHPPRRTRIEQLRRRLLPAVAAALPRKHRAAPAVFGRRETGGGEPARAVPEHGLRHFGPVQGEQRHDEQFVPEDVAAIAFPVQTAHRYPRIMFGRVLGERLREVEQVQIQHEPGLGCRSRRGRSRAGPTARPRPHDARRVGR